MTEDMSSKASFTVAFSAAAELDAKKKSSANTVAATRIRCGFMDNPPLQRRSKVSATFQGCVAIIGNA
ncbi:MAG: hypothetical protein L0219_11425, partial [Phycisphaerales bacterium]|nr:hypothetical protein [Phycisphaerales bacterium]